MKDNNTLVPIPVPGTDRQIKRAVGDGRYRVIQSAIESGYHHPKTGVLVLDAPQPRVTPKGVQRILVDHGGAA